MTIPMVRFLLCFMLCVMGSGAQAFGVSVAPTSILLNPKTGFAHLELSNQGKHTRLFTVEPSDPAQSACYKVSPRQISLPPESTQTIRLQYTCNLQDIHENTLLYFTEMPVQGKEAVADNQLEFRLRLGLKVKTQQSALGSLF